MGIMVTFISSTKISLLHPTPGTPGSSLYVLGPLGFGV